MAEPLEHVFTTTNVGEAEALVQQVYARAELRESGGDFHYEQTTRGATGVNFTRFKINSRMDIAVDFDGVAAFGLRLGGRYAAQSNGRALDARQPFLFVPGQGTSASEDLDILMVNIDVETLERAAGQQLGADSATLTFHSNHASSDAMRRHWLRTIGYAWTNVLSVPEVFRDEAIRDVTIELVTTAALAGFDIEGKTNRRSTESGSSAAVRRAAAFMDNHADLPLTVAAVAAAARLSVRGLQLGFQREFGITPMAYLRAVRLEAARAELLAADAAEDHVATIARRWAFANPGRFAALYRARFNERPGDTLRR